MTRPRASALSGAGVRVLLAGTAKHAPGSVLPDVPAVDTSVGDLASVLVRRCGLDPANLTTVVDPADPAVLGAALGEAASAADRLLLFYFVGHGLVSAGGELHLATAATKDLSQGLATYQALPYSEVRTALADCRAPSVVVVLDCCFSGRAKGSVSSVVDDAFSTSQIRGAYLLTSAARDELALTVPGERHTVFTGALLDLVESGDLSDLAAPRWLTLDYLYRRLARGLSDAGFPRPYRHTSDRVGELVLASNPAWTAPTRRHAPDVDADELAVCPYPGLASFGRDDARLFFGRERLTEELLGVVGAARGPVVVVGPSGSGKSSLLRAGLLASLAPDRPHLLLTPTADPSRELVTRLIRHAGVELTEDAAPTELRQSLGGRSLLLVVDQFEELFTACADEQRRVAYLELLAALSAPAEDGAAPAAVVVIGVRADFYRHLTRYPLLTDALRHRQVVVGAMSTADLRAVIEKPAEEIGLALEDGLTDLVLRDVGAADTDPTAGSPLPFLSHALYATWQQRAGRLLTLAGYQETGGIWDAISSTADASYTALDEADQEIARRLLLGMVRIGDGVEHTRRRLVVDELAPSDGASRVLRRLADARLVTLDTETNGAVTPAVAHISHEALIRGWPRLRAWIEQDRDGLLIHRRLTESAQAWVRGGRNRADLDRGPRLTTALDWARDRTDLTTPEREFLAAGRDARHRTTAIRLTAAVVSAVLVAAVLVAGTVAVIARGDAAEQLSRELAVSSANQADTDPAGAMRDAVRAWNASPTADARSALLSAQLLTPPVQYTAADHPAMAEADAIDVDRTGRLLAVGRTVGGLLVWDTRTRRPVLDVPPTGSGDDPSWDEVRFSPNGRLVAAASFDMDGVRVWDLSTGRLLFTLPGRGTLAWSPDGFLATVVYGPGDTWLVREWDVTTGAPRGAAFAPGPFVADLDYRPSGAQLAIGRSGSILEVWDRSSGTLLNRITDHGGAFRWYSSQGLVSASARDSMVWLWNGDNGTPEGWLRVGPTRSSDGDLRPLKVVPFGAANRLLVSTGGALTYWDATTEVQRGELSGNTEPIEDFAVSNDERTVVATTATRWPSSRTTVLVWRLTANRLDDLAAAATSLAVDPRTGEFAATDDTGALYTWDGRPFAGDIEHGKFVAYSSHGHRVVATDDRIAVSDPSGRRLPTVSLSDGNIGTVAVSAEAGFVAAYVSVAADGIAGGTVRVWPLDGVAKTGKTISVPFAVGDLTFSPDGRWLLGVMIGDQTTDEWTRVWRTGDFTQEAFVVRDDSEVQATYTADSQSVVVAGDDDGTIDVHDYPSGDLERSFGTHPGPVMSVTISPDGRTVATTNEDDPDIRLWDMTTGELFATLRGHRLYPGRDENPIRTAFTGDRLVSAGTDADVFVWQLDPAKVKTQICRTLADIRPRDLVGLGCG